VERLQNEHTLIADAANDRVLEVDREGNTVWEVRNLPGVMDADRLANGNTLVTLRTLNRVIEIRPDGSIAFELAQLEAPSDADRLPNGHTLVAEHGMVREFDAQRGEVWRKTMTWAVEANRR